MDESEMVARYEAGESLVQIARAAHMDKGRLRVALVAHGVTIRPLGNPLTSAQEAAIVARYQAGESRHDLARAFRVAGQRIDAALAAGGITSLRPRGRELTPATVTALAADYQAGAGLETLATRAGVRKDRLRAVFQAAGVALRPPNAPKFSPQVEDEIVARYAGGEGAQKLGAAYACTPHTILDVLRRHDVTIAPQGPRYRQFTPQERAAMRQQYAAGASQSAIARTFGTHQAIVSRVLREDGLTPERRPRRGAASNQWKGGRIHTAGGYVRVLMAPDHPFATAMRDRTGYVLEHRLVMAEALGRPLLPHETVHHIDGQHDHNDLHNLQLRFGRHGKGAVYCCADCGSTHIVAVPLAPDATAPPPDE